MARDRIEELAITNLKKVLLRSKYVIPQISENDKTPSFDGELLVYSTEDHTKDQMEGLIPVQVKGVTVETFMGKCAYPFAWADLENYYKDKGCLFFVVQLLGSDDEQYRIYYKEWPLLELQKILQKYPAPREHETISFPLREFPAEKDAIDSVLFTFCNDMRKQMVVNGWTQLPSLEEYDGGKFEIQLTAFGTDKLQPLQVLTKEARYIYKRTPQGLVPVAEGKVKIRLDTEQDMKVTVNGVPFVRFNDFVGRIGYLRELEDKYELGYGIHATPLAANSSIRRADGSVQPSGVEELYKRVEQLVSMPSDERRSTFQSRRQKMLSEKIDAAKFLTWFIENYPASADQTRKADISFWDRFK